MVPEVLDLAHQYGHQEPPFMAALRYLYFVRGGATGSGSLGSEIDLLLFFLGGLPKTGELRRILGITICSTTNRCHGRIEQI
jgi:hypothetical protein